MAKPTPKTEPRFVEDDIGHTDPLPIFVTRMTLRATLNKHGAEKLSGPSTSLIYSKPDGLIPSNLTMGELLSRRSSK